MRGRRSSAPIAGRRSSRRWRRSTATDLFPPACVVVNAGTAVTIDALDANGVFHGGLILPGMRLMLQALAENTAGLKVPPGAFQAFPDNTADAIYSRIDAGDLRRDRADAPADRYQSGAGPLLSRRRRRARHRDAPDPPVEVVDTLVLEGVLALAGDEIRTG